MKALRIAMWTLAVVGCYVSLLAWVTFTADALVCLEAGLVSLLPLAVHHLARK